ncbi:alpha/beta fold hydrolase [Roseovarius indicus]|nr:alpha/beta hydrolase [Roseovarius indicus]
MPTESSGNNDELVTQGLDDILSVLPRERGDPPLKLVTWRPAVFLESGGVLRPTDPTLRHTASHQTATRFFDSVREEGMPIAFGVEGDDLVVRVIEQSAGTAGFTALLDPDCLSEFLMATFPAASLSPALRRVLVLQMSGIGLKEGARLDNRSVETRKRQAQHLRERFDGADLSTISRKVAAALVLALAAHVNPPRQAVGRTLADYVNRYMPKGVRAYGLTSADGRTSTPVLDMGRPDARPVIVLHPMALPDIRAAEIEACERIGLRLIWPLRHGTLDPGASALTPEAHMEHAVRGAELAITTVAHDRVPVLAFAAASKVGLALARAHPERVSALHVAGACVREGRPETGARRLARGVLALAAQRPMLLDPVLGHLEGRLRRPGALKQLLEAQFSDSPADAAIVARDLHGTYGVDRFSDSLLDSAASARHDFLFQADLGWHRAPADLAIQLHHGAQDAIHPLPLIEALADSLPNARLHVLPGAGQLVWYEHLHRVLERVAAE